LSEEWSLRSIVELELASATTSIAAEAVLETSTPAPMQQSKKITTVNP
jgi:hypothetical protein